MLVLWVLAAYSAVIYWEFSIGEIPFLLFAFFYRTLDILAIIYIYIYNSRYLPAIAVPAKPWS